MVDVLSADHIAPKDGFYEPQRSRNFLFEVHGLPSPGTASTTGDGAGADVWTASLDGAFLPEISNEPIELNYLNEKRYVAGATVFTAGEVKLKDFIDRGGAEIMNAWREQVYNPNNGKIGLAATYKKEATILLFGPDGSRERSWQIIGAFPSSVKYGELDMTSNDKVLITATIRYDKAIPKLSTGATIPTTPTVG